MSDDIDARLLLLHPRDNVFVVRSRIAAGSMIRIGGRETPAPRDIGLGHKIARTAIAEGEPVLKYSAPIGRATQAIAAGDHVHVHNIVSSYTPTHTIPSETGDHP